VYEMVEESRTAKLPGRPLFNEMLERIERGEANGILCWDIDRLYRNPIDEGRVRWLLQRGIIASIRTPSREFLPDDAGLLMGVEGGRATDYIIRLAKGVKRGTDEKLRRGEWPGQKPLGYMYDHRLRNIVPDPKRAEIVQEVYEKCATGDFSLNAVAELLFERGVRSRGGKLWSNSAVRKFLSNRLYIGVMDWSGEVFEGKYKPLLSAELYNSVQRALKNRGKPRKRRLGHQFPFCGTFHCSCGSMITAQFGHGHGGVYRYCRCTRKGPPCSEPYVQEKEVARQCVELLRPLGVSRDEAEGLRQCIAEASAAEAKTLDQRIRKMERDLSGIQEKIDRLTRGYLDELIDEDSFRAAQEEFVVAKAELKRELTRLRRTRASAWIEPTTAVINRLESIGSDEFGNSLSDISTTVKTVGSNPLVSAKTVTFSLVEPYAFIPSMLASARVATLGDRASLRGEEPAFTLWCAIQGSNL
ncbi:MAG TPA: recombinase family protein, partial [Chthoniobacteraceae bacterium]